MLHNLMITMMISYAMFMLYSCTKSEPELDTQTSAAWIANKQWRVSSYTVSPDVGNDLQVNSYSNYNLDFRPNFEFDVDTGDITTTGARAVYRGVKGNLLQLSYSEIGNAEYKLKGTWVIDNQTMTTLDLYQEIQGATLKVLLEQN
jgi:hypothetical protein